MYLYRLHCSSRSTLSLVVLLFCVEPLKSQQSQNADGRGNTTNEPTLKVMTWNLEWFYDENQNDNYSDLAKEKAAPSRQAWDWRRDSVAESLSRVQPDVIALQEIENRRVLWYLSSAMKRNYQQNYFETCIEGRDFFTEQDVGFLTSSNTEVISESFHGFPPSLRQDDRYYSVTKHLQTTIHFVHDGERYPVVIFNTHLRSRAEAAEIRIKQARSIKLWLAETIRSGADVIVLGDINTEQVGDITRTAPTDMMILCGLDTEDPADDLVDLTRSLSIQDRQTHLIEGKEFDRILCSQSLIEDDPTRKDLVFAKIENLKQLCIKQKKDTQEQHWDHYWDQPTEERDLSDHLPLMATFELK